MQQSINEKINWFVWAKACSCMVYSMGLRWIADDIISFGGWDKSNIPAVISLVVLLLWACSVVVGLKALVWILNFWFWRDYALKKFLEYRTIDVINLRDKAIGRLSGGIKIAFSVTDKHPDGEYLLEETGRPVFILSGDSEISIVKYVENLPMLHNHTNGRSYLVNQMVFSQAGVEFFDDDGSKDFISIADAIGHAD